MTPRRPAPADGHRLRVATVDPRFADAVVSDVGRIGRTRTGRRLFRHLHEAGISVTVIAPELPTDPPNAWTLADDAGAIIAYQPGDWPCAAYAESLASDAILFRQLRHALGLRSGAAIDEDTALEVYLRECRP